MKRALLSFITFGTALTVLASGCGARAVDPQERFEQDLAVPGLSKTEPTPEEVAAAAEQDEEHPTIKLGTEPAEVPAVADEPVANENPVITERPVVLEPVVTKPVIEPVASEPPALPTEVTPAPVQDPLSPVTAAPESTLWPKAAPKTVSPPAVAQKPATPAAAPQKKTAKLVDSGSPKAANGKGDDGLSFCHTAKWSNACLTGLLIYRCGQYTSPFTPYGCALATANFVDLLQLKRIDVTFENDQGQMKTYSLPVIFTSRLAKMIEDPKVQEQIRALLVQLNTSLQEKKPFDLWSWTVKTMGGNTTQALEWLSVLLQDTSAIQIQIEYLRILDKDGKLSAGAQRATDALAEIVYFLSYEHLLEIKWQEWLKLYPQTKNIETEVTPLIYHLYPMAYLAGLMKPVHGQRLAAFIPFLFNTEYLNQDLDPEMWPLHHPRSEKIDLKQGRIQWKMRDMYGGLAGALLGVNKIDKTPGLKVFQEAYAKNPFSTMQKLFWTIP